MTMARSESNSKPILSAGDLHLVTVYDSSLCSSFPPIFFIALRTWRVNLYHSLSAMAEYIAYKWTGRQCYCIYTGFTEMQLFNK